MAPLELERILLESSEHAPRLTGEIGRKSCRIGAEDGSSGRLERILHTNPYSLRPLCYITVKQTAIYNTVNLLATANDDTLRVHRPASAQLALSLALTPLPTYLGTRGLLPSGKFILP